MSVLRRLNLDYRPAHQNRGQYDELVKEEVWQMEGHDKSQETTWNTPTFKRETWLGHRQNETGFWIVVNDGFIVRSGDAIQKRKTSSSPTIVRL